MRVDLPDDLMDHVRSMAVKECRSVTQQVTYMVRCMADVSRNGDVIGHKGGEREPESGRERGQKGGSKTADHVSDWAPPGFKEDPEDDKLGSVEWLRKHGHLPK